MPIGPGRCGPQGWEKFSRRAIGDPSLHTPISPSRQTDARSGSSNRRARARRAGYMQDTCQHSSPLLCSIRPPSNAYLVPVVAVKSNRLAPCAYLLVETLLDTPCAHPHSFPEPLYSGGGSQSSINEDTKHYGSRQACANDLLKQD